MECILLPVKETKNITVDKDTQFVLDFDKNYNELVELNFVFNTPNVKANILGIYKVLPQCKIQFSTNVIHLVSNTNCLINIRTILLDESMSNYIGKIKILEKLQKIESFLSHKTLVVGEKTHSVSNPILEISTNNIRASHNSTTTRITDSDGFYLKSRGLTTIESSNLILDGFIQKQLSEIVDIKIKNYIEKKLLTCV